LLAPRVRFVGVYQQKEQYTRLGTKDLNQFYDPVHLVEFYRYIRFFPDGGVLYIISVKKLLKEQILKFMDSQRLVNKVNGENIMRGEYIIKEEKAFIKLYSPTDTIYEVELRIGGSDLGKFDRMQLIDHKRRSLGYDVAQSIKSKGHQNKKFKFIPVPEFRVDIENSLIRGVTN